MFKLPSTIAPTSPLHMETQVTRGSETLPALADTELAAVRGGASIVIESGGTITAPDSRVVLTDRVYRK